MLERLTKKTTPAKSPLMRVATPCGAAHQDADCCGVQCFDELFVGPLRLQLAQVAAQERDQALADARGCARIARRGDLQGQEIRRLKIRFAGDEPREPVLLDPSANFGDLDGKGFVLELHDEDKAVLARLP